MKHRRTPPAAVAAVMLAILFAGCATGEANDGAGCDDALAQATAIDPASDTVSALDGAIASCPSLETWVAAASRYPDTTAGQDPVAYALTRCTASRDLADTPVCLGLPGQTPP